MKNGTLVEKVDNNRLLDTETEFSMFSWNSLFFFMESSTRIKTLPESCRIFHEFYEKPLSY